jgi:hypothetical protein
MASGRPYELPTRVADEVYLHYTAGHYMYLFKESLQLPGVKPIPQWHVYTVDTRDQTIGRTLISEESYKAMKGLMNCDVNWLDCPQNALPQF